MIAAERDKVALSRMLETLQSRWHGEIAPGLAGQVFDG